MPDTGEDREIRQRVNAKESEIELEAINLVEKSKQQMEQTVIKRRRIAKKKREAESSSRFDRQT